MIIFSAGPDARTLVQGRQGLSRRSACEHRRQAPASPHDICRQAASCISKVRERCVMFRVINAANASFPSPRDRQFHMSMENILVFYQ
jgi:hypothetical protein